jgi:hypothetical protein
VKEELRIILKYICKEAKRELLSVGVIMLSVVPIVTIVLNYGLCIQSIKMIVAICIGWCLVLLDKVVNHRKSIFGMPIAKKRFTSEENGVIIINVNDINEISEYLYSLEEYLEKVGSSKWT